MPNSNFLEKYPLYKKFEIAIPEAMNSIPKVRINMSCANCKANQTFAMINEYYERSRVINISSKGENLRLQYICAHCEQFERLFFIVVSDDLKSIMKIGQFPAWDIAGNLLIESKLGKYASYYKKGLICESQSFGIGAFGYYRRIIENIIDELLEDISKLLTGAELEEYNVALVKVKKTTVTQEKIDLVKDLLPPILRPEGLNPLNVLHSTLSQGLHAESDEACIEYSETLREALIFLTGQINSSLQTSQTFTQNMRKLLDKKK